MLVDKLLNRFLGDPNRASDMDGVQLPSDSHAIDLAFTEAEAFCCFLDG